MKNFLILLAVLFTSTVLQAQTEPTGTIVGKLTDKEMNGEPLPFANVVIKGTTKGTTTDYDGLYTLKDMDPGTYSVVFSFVGYEERVVPNVKVVPGKVTEINAEIGSSAAALEEVVIKTVSRKDSEVALLLEQKGAVEIKESIGAQQLAKLGVSDAATATTKISGVTSSEASGDVFVRGLGDRYLYTTMNGLPIPSDDVERKNIDLELFPTRVIQSVSISKTYSAKTSADQASGNIDISSRELTGTDELAIGVKAGVNTNAIREGVADNFKVSPNMDDVTMGFYSKDYSTTDILFDQTWNPQVEKSPINRQFSLIAGTRISEKLKVFGTASQSTSFEHRQGVFREFRSNFINDSITDAETFSKSINTSGLADISYNFNDDNRVKFTSLFINKLTDEVFEGGRNGEATFYEETDRDEDLSQFVRDQNIKQTRLLINQLAGNHKIGKKNELDWAAGVNRVDADEPNRIRNEVNFKDDFVQLGRTGGFQQRKSVQIINDLEFNGRIQDKFTITDTEEKQLNFTLGGNFRNKERDFVSQFLGFDEASNDLLHPDSIDNLSSVFTRENRNSGDLLITELNPDYYIGDLTSAAGFATVNYGLGKFNLNIGVRYQKDDLDVTWDVGNIPGRIGSASKSYNNLYPSINLRYAASEKSNIRLAASKTLTLPEFKEISPFEYVSATGQVTRGNPELEASSNYNLDLKYEFFPSSGQLVSLTSFYKRIEDPINKVQTRGAAGIFSYFNSGDKAEIYGLELESRIDLLTAENENGIDLNMNLNATRMWHSQDLKEMRGNEGQLLRTFRYKGLTETGLQGASDWIFNGSLNMVTNTERPFSATLTANYASDKIYALGSPESQTQNDIFYNDAIVEKGFVNLDAVLTQEIGNNWNVILTGKNLLNPEIERTQKIKPSTTGIETTKTVRSYTRGSIISLGVNYSF